MKEDIRFTAWVVAVTIIALGLALIIK